MQGEVETAEDRVAMIVKLVDKFMQSGTAKLRCLQVFEEVQIGSADRFTNDLA